MWNESAWQAARELWQPGDRVGDQNHSGDWGQYGDLQLGNVDRSELWIERAEQTLRENPGDGRSSATLKTMRARHVIETQQWQLTALSDELSADELLAPRHFEHLVQTAALWSMKTKGTMALPAGYAAAAVYRSPAMAEGKRLYALLETPDDGKTYDARLVDEDGVVYVELCGYETVSLM